jgi:hypothetical protein
VSVIKRESENCREIRDIKIARLKIDEDAKDSINPFGSRSQARPGSSMPASVTLGLSLIMNSNDVERSFK